MRTRAERAQALLLSSGLPCFLWKEAMDHSMWLQNRALAHAINRKTPYEMRHKMKPNLAGIQEFGAAAFKAMNEGATDYDPSEEEEESSALAGTVYEPNIYKQAMRCPDAELWQKAAEEEMTSLYLMVLGTLFLYQRIGKLLDVDGCLKSKRMQIDLLKDRKPDSLPKDTHRGLV